MPLPSITPSGVSTAWQYRTQVSAGQGYTTVIDAIPPFVNAPIFYEPMPLLSQDRLLLWIVVTAPPPNWGGSQIWASADGGTSYGQIGLVFRGGVQGVTTADYPIHSDPDTVDTLSVNVTESGGQITAGSTTDADLGVTLGYLDGTTPELIGYSAATLTSAFHYDLKTYIRRGMFGTPISDHPIGHNFALLNGNTFAIVYPSNMVGVTINFKFPSFNTVGGELQPLSAVPAYPYTLTGVGLSPSSGGGSCPVIVVLAGGACCVELGVLGECVSSNCDLGVLGTPVTQCLDLGVLGL